MARCTHDLWHNELNRWDRLSNKQLVTRLNRITKPEKLACFLNMARQTRNYHLYQRAVERCNRLGLVGIERGDMTFDVVPVPPVVYGDNPRSGGVAPSRASSTMENAEGPDFDDIPVDEMFEEKSEIKGVYDRLHKRKLRRRKR